MLASLVCLENRVFVMYLNILLRLGLRWMLGLFGAGLFPGVAYYLSW